MIAHLIWTFGAGTVSYSRTRLRILRNKSLRALDLDKTVWLSPARIVYCSLREFDTRDFRGAVIGGDWDRLKKRFEDLDVYVALKQVMTEGRKWQDTVYYQRIVRALKDGKFLWGCRSEGDLQNQCMGLENLFQTIKTKGYKSQQELLRASRLRTRLETDDEVTISIGRDGDLLFSNSAHRLSIAKLLRIQQIPVKIAVRHKKWMLFREELLQFARDQRSGTLYQPLTHPDLIDIPASRYSEDRFIMIGESMQAKKGRLLDLGANLGYFCHKFEDEGFECQAVENAPRELYFLGKLRRAENKRFRIIDKSIYEWPEAGKIYFDVVLALSIFHHALKTKESYHQLISLLRSLRVGEIFFEPPRENEPQMASAFRNFPPSEFVKFIMRLSGLDRAQLIGRTSDGRDLYRLSKRSKQAVPRQDATPKTYRSTSH